MEVDLTVNDAAKAKLEINENFHAYSCITNTVIVEIFIRFFFLDISTQSVDYLILLIPTD